MDALNISLNALSPEVPANLHSLPTWRTIALALIIYILAYGSIVVARTPALPTALPRVGRQGKGWIYGVIASFKGLTKLPQWNKEGYEKYNKHGRSFILPGMPGSPDVVVLPHDQMKWFIDQPDSILSSHDAHYDQLHSDYSFVRPQLIKDPYHEQIIHRVMPRHLNALIPDLEDEIEHAIDNVFGLDEEQWKSMNLWDTLRQIVPGISNRMIIGLPLCRNQPYLDHMTALIDSTMRIIALLNITPAALKPIIGRLLGLFGWYSWRQGSTHTLPVIKKRLHDMLRKEAGDPDYSDWTPPNDYITWHIKLAMSDGRHDELDPTQISLRLVPLNFAAIHTTTTVAFATIVNLAASDPTKGYLPSLFEEGTHVWTEEGNKATKNGLSRLFRTDSAIRESMRVSHFAQVTVDKAVVVKEGITNPVEGWHAPKGTILTMNAMNVMHDPDIYNEPLTYDAFRYSRDREAWEARDAAEKTDLEAALQEKRKSMVTTSDTHFPWGHGKHACPGRFFVAHELKILLSYLVRNYDIQPLAVRPETKWLGPFMIPPMDTKIEMRRKKGTTTKRTPFAPQT